MSEITRSNKNLRQNIRNLPGTITLSAIVAGFLPVIISYTGPLLIVMEAARAGGLTEAQTSSWVCVLMVGNGLMTIALSLYYRLPITSPYSTAGAALLVTSIALYPYPQVIGAYLLAGLMVALVGVSGLFGRMMALVPQPVVMGMLAGVLLRFGIGIFASLPDEPTMIIAMIVVYFLLKRANFRAPSLGVLLVGVLYALVNGQLNFGNVSLALSTPLLTVPEFTPSAALSLALPLFALALSAQYAPGQAVLRSFGYEAPINGILTSTGLFSMLLGLFGGHGNTLGALTAALVMSPEANPDPKKRYGAAVASGALHILFGVFGATVVGLFTGLPPALIAGVAGLALSGTIASSLAGAMQNPHERDGALVAFLCTAANFTFLGVGAPFWGLVAGVLVNTLMQYGKPQMKNDR